MKRIKTSKYKGVSRSRKRWRCYLRKDGVDISKSFDTELEAAEFYNLHSEKPNRLKKRLKCTDCGVEKEKYEFYTDLRKDTSCSSVCIKCQIIRTAINNAIHRKRLPKSEESLEYLKIDRIIKLIEKGVITKDEGRDLYNREDAIKCAYAFRLKGKESPIASNSV